MGKMQKSSQSIQSFSRQSDPSFTNDAQTELDHSLSATSNIFEAVQVEPELRPADEPMLQPMTGYVEPAKMHSGNWNIPGPAMNAVAQDMYPNIGEYSPQYDNNNPAIMTHPTYNTANELCQNPSMFAQLVGGYITDGQITNKANFYINGVALLLSLIALVWFCASMAANRDDNRPLQTAVTYVLSFIAILAFLASLVFFTDFGEGMFF